MQADQGKFLLDFLLPQVQQEVAITRKVLAAIPENQRHFRPHPMSRSAFEIAWHIASWEIWALDGIIQGQFVTEQERMPSYIQTVGDILTWYTKNIPELHKRLTAMTSEELTRNVPFFGVLNQPAVAYLNTLIGHSAHHRGQLTTYLRQMGGKVPSIYGESADEPFYKAQPA